MLINNKLKIVLLLPLLAIATDLSDIISYFDDLNNSPTIENSEKQLVDVIRKFHSYSQGNNLTNNNDIKVHYICGDTISHRDVQDLESNLLLVLKHLYKVFRQMLPGPTINAVDDVDANRRIEYTVTDFDYLETICSYIPQTLDFTYFCTLTMTSLIQVLNLHSVVCNSLRKIVAESCSVDQHKGKVRLCDIKHDNMISSDDVVLPVEPKHVMIPDNYHQEVGQRFIMTMHKIVIRIDKTKIIKSSPWYSKYIFRSQVKSQSSNLKLRSPKFYDFQRDQDYQSKYNSLLGFFDFFTSDFQNSIIENSIIRFLNKPYDTDQPEVTVPNIINQFMLNIFKRLNNYLQNHFFEHFEAFSDNETSKIDEKSLENKVSEMFDGLCAHVPLILYFLNKNQFNDTELYSLYFTLCSDWIGFLNVRCPRDESGSIILYEVDCVKRSIHEKLLVNNLMMTKTKSYDEYRVENDQIMTKFNVILEKLNVQLLDTFYRGKNVFQWPSIVWLSGRYFLTKHHSSADMNKLKELEIMIDDKPVTLVEAFFQLLPWNCNLKTVLIFHNEIMRNVHRMMNLYVYQQSKIVLLYFEHTSNGVKIEHQVLQRLGRTFQWYTLGTRHFYKYFLSPAIIYSSPENVVSIISAIKNISETGKEQSIELITNNIPEEQWHHLEVWAKNNSLNSDNDNENLVEKLNSILLENCKDATTFINDFFWIVRKSEMIDTFMGVNAYNLLCDEYNRNIFINSEFKGNY